MEKDKKIQRRKPKQARAEQKYNAILDASARVLQAVGYRRATMSEIHLESGYPYATIYQYFSNKEDIYLAWLERFMRNALLELSDELQRAGALDLNERIDLSVRFVLTQIVQHRPTVGRLLNGMSLVSSRLVEWLEDKSLEWIHLAFGPQVSEPHNAALLEKMLTATRVGNGYWLMLVLNTKREINIQTESQNVAALVKALLFRA
ncbi:MAG TPA: helix-turn-helix domain-containing protein [Pseudomonadales bacterium]|nr:helix-turn-helix domain-containing protein [Pseudomonadales bacterium]